MDGNRFDDLSRKFATGMSRRKALTGFAAGIAGALGLRGGAEGQVSQAYCGDVSCRTNPSKCKEGCVCCVWPNNNSRCMPPNRCGETILCPPGKVADPIRGCIDPCTTASGCPQPAANSCKVATCSAGGLCGFTSAPNNTTCGGNNICCGGSCVAGTTASNCRTCGTTCSGNTPVCNASTGCVQCSVAADCPAPNTAICQGAATCNAGVCQYGTAANNTSCGSGKVCCGGTCTVNTTVTNCGTCGNACSANQVCTGGTCTCPNATCNGACCAPGQVCIGGICSPRGGPGDVCDAGQDGDCQAGLTCCNGRCRNLQTSLNHCGACFNDCPNGAAGTCQGTRTCTAGVCGFNPANQGTICRPADASGCDVTEVCNGSSLACPADGKAPDETVCTGGECCNGICCSGGTSVCKTSTRTCVQCVVNGDCSGSTPICNTSTNTCVACLTPANCQAPANQCREATCVANVCGEQNKSNGTTCNDNNACTTGDVCTAGVCGGTAVVCPTPDQCHLPGTCNPDTGICSNPPKTDGSTCNDGNACTNNDICTAGMCAGTLISGCVLCTTTANCASVPVSQCQEAVCGQNGTCVVQNKANGVACEDGLFCTTGDTCQSGSCVGGPPPNCSSFTDQCNTGVCDETMNACVAQPVSNGTTCSDGLFCTVNDVCTAGVCGGVARDCSSFSGQCTVGVCDEDANTCVARPANVGQTCSDGNLCTTGETCQANGTCGGGTATVCSASDQCHVAGTCDPATGICSNPNKANGTACNDANACTQSDTCQAGVCTGGNPVTCNNPPTGDAQCYDLPGLCNPGSGTCSYTPEASGTPCTTSGGAAGTCNGTGTCVPFVCTPNSSRPCYTGPAGTQNVGVCTAGTETCNSAGSAYGACVGQVLPSAEICDGFDNDCDGVVDDGIVGIGAPCSTGQLGICAAGTTQCVNGTTQCVRTQAPQAEICNGLDDDCNGVIDNGAPCPVGQACVSGSCVPTCGAANSTGCTGTVNTQGSCCAGLICNSSRVCEPPCDPLNPTDGCLCNSNSAVCPASSPCCKSAGGSPTRCNNGDGNCACTSDASCTGAALGNKDFCCSGECVSNSCGSGPCGSTCNYDLAYTRLGACPDDNQCQDDLCEPYCNTFGQIRDAGSCECITSGTGCCMCKCKNP